GESFCGAGKQFHALLTELQGNAVADMLEVDAIETLEPEKDVVEWVNTIKDKLLA
ncbi:MAG: flavodoxin, partial [Pseudomonadota bacterium]|nr:flavodoxin [Pseudomonadota bacterium]